MKIGYARVSTDDQNCDAQIKALTEAGCKQVYSENISGRNADRPELEAMLTFIRKGDILIVTKLDRLARSISDLIKIVERLNEKEAVFQSLAEALDLSTPHGRFAMNVFASAAQFELELASMRTQEGLALARSKGRVGGRRKILNALQESEVIERVERGDLTQKDVAGIFRVSPATVKRIMKRHRDQSGGL